MELNQLWFILIAVLWIGYLILEGFDLGVGMLLKILPKGDASQKEKERRVMINTIGPVWDGNEVWLLTAGGATFAAFPEWYATLFSGFYLPLFLILLALIWRGVSFEYRGKVSTKRWTNIWDWGITVGSWLPSILWGVAFANLVRGVQLDSGHQFTGGFFSLLTPFALLGGLCLLSLLLLHGSVFLALKTDGQIRGNANKLASRLAIVAIVLAGAWAIWAQLAYGKGWTWIAVVLAAGGLVGVFFMNAQKREGYAFILSAVVLVAAVVLIFGSMYPNVMPAHDAANSLTITNASSSNYTLTVMTWVAVIMVPIVLAYSAWSYWVFRRRISTAHIPLATGLTLQKFRAAAFGGTAPGGAK